MLNDRNAVERALKKISKSTSDWDALIEASETMASYFVTHHDRDIRNVGMVCAMSLSELANLLNNKQ